MTAGKDSLWKQGRDETVEVNQRALIDKVLARYSGEFTVFRELVQNADDARATIAEIRFETKQYLLRGNEGGQEEGPQGELASSMRTALPDLKKSNVDQWTFRNNGIPFRNEDWNRLKKIADGNPDEETIGAFGVGFYSLFSVTDEPFVKSGVGWMGFYWRNGGDQLFARRGDLPTDSNCPGWTTFEMPLREPAPLPGLPLDISRFLATSLTFMTHLKSISIFHDGICIAKVEKEVGMPRKLAIPQGLKLTSPARIMNVTGMTSTSLYMRATILRWAYNTGTNKASIPSAKAATRTTPTQFFGFFAPFASTHRASPILSTPSKSSQDPLEMIDSTTQLSVFAANVSVSLDNRMNAEMERATKKRPPSTTKYQLIYTGKDEYEASKREDETYFEDTGGLFQGLRADLDGAGRAHIFIGHATAQTTGIGGHVSARFIPTVERESIDLVDRNVSIWNKELLYIGGLLARAIYEREVNSIGKLWTDSLGSTPFLPAVEDDGDGILRAWLQSRCIHTLQFFSAHRTTPSAIVAEHFQNAFFVSGESPNRSFPIISNLGVRPAKDVRVYNAALVGFLKVTPMLPPEVSQVDSLKLMLAPLQARGMCLDVTTQDILKEVQSRILGEQEFIALLKWRMGLKPERTGTKLKDLKEIFLNSVRIYIEKEGGKDRIVCLGSIRTFINPRTSIIPLDIPLPGHTFPHAISKQLDGVNLGELFGWTELSVTDWVTNISQPPTRKEIGMDIAFDPEFAGIVLRILARAWPSISTSEKKHICAQLTNIPCIPTRAGVKVPREAYLPSAHDMLDAPVVDILEGTAIRGALEKVLVALGVRRHADIDKVIGRVTQTGDWTAVDLVKYLVSVRNTLSTNELDILKKMAVFCREGEQADRDPKRYAAQDLYEPVETLRCLGLPILFWGPIAKWRSGSAAKLMFELGLNRFPSLDTILTLAASPDTGRQTAALKYFLDNYTTRYSSYQANTAKDLAFVPAIKPDGVTFLASPTTVFSNVACGVMGFNIVDSSILDKEAIVKLKIASDPPLGALLDVLLRTPSDNPDLARGYYEYLAGRISDFTAMELKQISDTAFIPASFIDPTKKEKNNSQQLFKPTQVYFGCTGSQDDVPSGLFIFVDFGPKAAIFLRAVGVKDKPTTRDVCEIIMQSPKSFRDAVGGYQEYLIELRKVGAEIESFPGAIVRQMAQSPMLLGMRRTTKAPWRGPDGRDEPGPNDAEIEIEFQYEILPAEDILIIDDTHANSLFGHEIWGAPQEDEIEQFYERLGSKRLSSLVSEEYKNTPSGSEANKKRAYDTRVLVLERLPLFLHAHTHRISNLKPEWFAQDNNFQVVMVERLQLTRYLGNKSSLSFTQEVSAGARRDGDQGTVVLWLAENSQTDFYEVAHALCKILFHRHGINDSLVFMTILSTDLTALKRRGFDVDRILNPQNAERETAEAARAQLEREKKQVREADVQAAAPVTKSTDIGPQNDAQALQLTPVPSVTDPAIKGKQKQGTFANLDKVRQRLVGSGGIGNRNTQESRSRLDLTDGGVPSSQSVSKPLGSSEVVASQDYIEHNLQMAIAACRPESRSLLRNRRKMTIVKESLNEGYCDSQGTAADYELAGEFAGYRVYVAKSIFHPGLLERHSEAITRFGKLVIRPLQSLYNLPTSSVNIFYGDKDGVVAFNRNGSLFLNFRSYQAWHDEQVNVGNLQKALISWYFTLAHEIAHNLVQPHNAEHEYYFSVTAELHMSELCRLL